MKQTIPVIGMACSACSANVERKLKSLRGVYSVSVNLSGRNVFVDFCENVITLEDMKREINDIGYDLVIESDRSAEEIERREYVLLRRKTILSWFLSILTMSITMHWITIGDDEFTNQTAFLLALDNIILCGSPFYKKAFTQLRHGFAGMDTLVMASTMITFLFSVFNTFWGYEMWTSHGFVSHTYYDASVMIITFVLTGRLLEEKAKNGTATSIRQLMGLAPKTAHLVVSASAPTQLVPITTIEVGDELEVLPGEKIPVDGEVIYAESFMTSDAAYVDESMITGEPVPVEKKKGANVLAGTIPNQGKIRLRACKIGENTALAAIIKMVQQAQNSKAPVQRIVDKVAGIFVPVVASLSILTFLLWWLIGGMEYLQQAIMCAVSVLVVACPCAMGLATPTALMVGIGKAADKKILIKDVAALESLRKVNAIVFDKTGTLTIPNENIDFTKSVDLPFEEREHLRTNVCEAIELLHRDNIETYLMSGDQEASVRYYAEKTGIDHYTSQALPSDKEQLIRNLQESGKTVAMVGDGINDTSALALADVSIAMGSGTDVAMDVAQVTMMSDDFLSVPQSLSLSKKTVAMIWQNLFWAFFYNIVSIPLAGGILYIFGISFSITPMWASALMAFSGVSVILNSLRLRFIR